MSSKSKKKLIIALIISLSVIIILAVSGIFTTNYFSPKSSLERMFSLRADMKLEEYYNCFDIPENAKNPTNTLEAYLASAKENGFEKIDSFNIEEISKDTFRVKYGDTVEELKLVKQTKKALGRFDTYKIQIESVSSPVLYIITPIGSRLTLDGKEIDKSLKVKEADIDLKYEELVQEETLENELITGLKNISSRIQPIDYYEYYDERYDHYCFVDAFDKSYTVNVATEYTEPFNDIITPIDDVYILRDLTLTDDDKNEIRELSEHFAQRFYYSMQDGNGFESLTSYMSDNEEVLDEMRTIYDELKGLFISDNIDEGYFDLYFREFLTNVHNPNLLDLNQCEYTAQMEISYSYSLIEYNGISENYETYTNELSEMSIEIKCIKENGKWVVSGAESLDMIF